MSFNEGDRVFVSGKPETESGGYSCFNRGDRGTVVMAGDLDGDVLVRREYDRMEQFIGVSNLSLVLPTADAVLKLDIPVGGEDITVLVIGFTDPENAIEALRYAGSEESLGAAAAVIEEAV